MRHRKYCYDRLLRIRKYGYESLLSVHLFGWAATPSAVRRRACSDATCSKKNSFGRFADMLCCRRSVEAEGDTAHSSFFFTQSTPMASADGVFRSQGAPKTACHAHVHPQGFAILNLHLGGGRRRAPRTRLDLKVPRNDAPHPRPFRCHRSRLDLAPRCSLSA